MRYSQIKHKVIDTTDLVSKVSPDIMPSFSDRHLIPPTHLVGDYIQRQRERLGVYRCYGIPLHHPDIEYVPHSLMIRDQRRYYYLTSVLVDTIPAFFFIGGGREASDHEHYYILSKGATKQYIKYLAREYLKQEGAPCGGRMPPVYDGYLNLKRWGQECIYQVGPDDDISYGVDIDSWRLEYGVPYYWDDEIRQWAPIGKL